MNQEELKTKIENLCNDEEYMKYLMSLGTAEKISEELKTKDIDISPEEIRQIGTLIRKKVNGELSDEELQQISVGFGFFGIYLLAVTAIVAAGCVAGVVVAFSKGYSC